MTSPSTRIPPIGLGTSGLGEAAYDAILAALELGYRHLDTAQTYGTEATIGRVLKASGVTRAEVFITTKVADYNLARATFLPSLRASLDKLGVDHVDLLLIHWPSPRDAVPLADYIGSLADAKAAGLARLIGVSNFPVALMEKAATLLGAGEIATNQVELHPYLQNRKVHDYCTRNGIAVTAYMPLGRGRLLNDAVIIDIARRTGAAPAAVTLAFLLQLGIVVIPASTRREHLAANLEAAKLALGADDMARLAALDRGQRMIDPAKAPAWD